MAFIYIYYLTFFNPVSLEGCFSAIFQKVERNLNFIIFFPNVKCVLLEISHFCVIRMMRKKNLGIIN